VVVRLLQRRDELPLITEAVGCILEAHARWQHCFEPGPQVGVHVRDKGVAIASATSPPSTASLRVVVVVGIAAATTRIATTRIAASAAGIVSRLIVAVSASIAPAAATGVAAAVTGVIVSAASIAPTPATGVSAAISDVSRGASSVPTGVASADTARIPAATGVTGRLSRVALSATAIRACVATIATATGADSGSPTPASAADGRPTATRGTPSLRRNQRTGGKACGGDQQQDSRDFHEHSSSTCI
jgi:hypothetical protein